VLTPRFSGAHAGHPHRIPARSSACSACSAQYREGAGVPIPAPRRLRADRSASPAGRAVQIAGNGCTSRPAYGPRARR